MLWQGVEKIWIFAWFMSCWENPSKSSRAAEKIQDAAKKNNEKVEANCTGFSAEFFGSQLVEMFCFARKKNNVDNGAGEKSTNAFLNP